MLSHNTAVATVPVKDLEIARKFYEEKLGLTKIVKSSKMGVAYQTGDCSLFVYQYDDVSPQYKTMVTWIIDDDIEVIIGELKGRGVEFEYEPQPVGSVRHGDLYVIDNIKVVWLKDPDGNIISLYQEKEE